MSKIIKGHLSGNIPQAATPIFQLKYIDSLGTEKDDTYDQPALAAVGGDLMLADGKLTATIPDSIYTDLVTGSDISYRIGVESSNDTYWSRYKSHTPNISNVERYRIKGCKANATQLALLLNLPLPTGQHLNISLRTGTTWSTPVTTNPNVDRKEFIANLTIATDQAFKTIITDDDNNTIFESPEYVALLSIIPN